MAATRALSPQYDFSSPFMRASIIVNPRQANERRYPLWFQGDKSVVSAPAISPLLNGYTGGDSSSTLTFDTLAFVSDVSVDLGMGVIPTISMTITPPLDLARKFIDSELIQWSTSALEVQFGYVLGQNEPIISPPYVGITSAPDVSFGTDISITFKAAGRAGFYLASEGASGIKVKKPRIEHVNDLVKAVGAKRGTDVLDEVAKQNLKTEEEIVTATQSYLNLIYEIARKCGCWLDLSKDEVRLVSFSQLVVSEPKAILAYFDSVGAYGPGSTSPGVYPILSASSNSSFLYMGHYAQDAIQKAQDKSAGTKTTEGKQEAKDAASQSKAQPAKKDKQSRSSKRTAPPASKKDTDAATAKQDAEVEMQHTQTDAGSGLELEVSTLGFPDILPGMNVEVIGLGKRIDAPYSVFKVSHKLSASGFETSLNLKSTSGKLTLALQQAFLNAKFGQNAPVTPIASPAGQLDTQKDVPVNPRQQPPPA